MKNLIALTLFLSIYTTAKASTPSIGLGNGIEFRTEFDEVSNFVAAQNYEEYGIRLGVTYKVHDSKNYRIALGGGVAYSEHGFEAIPKAQNEYRGYPKMSSVKLYPFIQLETVFNNFFIEVFYSNIEYKITRTRIVSIIENSIVRESRTDTFDGDNLGVFVGVRFTF